MAAAGTMKARPATTRPSAPARLRPTSIASSVEFGPGMRLVMPTRSTMLLVRQPVAALNDLAPRERDMGGRTAEADDAERAEHGEQLAQP